MNYLDYAYDIELISKKIKPEHVGLLNDVVSMLMTDDTEKIVDKLFEILKVISHLSYSAEDVENAYIEGRDSSENCCCGECY